MKTLFFNLFICLVYVIPVSAQVFTVIGTVSSNAGEKLPGVTVMTEGTARGTITDLNGNFEDKSHLKNK